jgi:predicted oxidoreductase
MWDPNAGWRDNKIKHYDYSKSHIIWSVEQSLKNLKTDYLDVFLLHRPSPLMQSDEIAEAVEKLKSEGKIVDFGLSNFTNSQTELIRQRQRLVIIKCNFRLRILNLWLTEVLIICNWIKFAQCLGIR